MKYIKLPETVHAIHFDPHGEHKMDLPPGIHGIHSPNADNWAYTGCSFFVDGPDGSTLEIYPGNYLITFFDGSRRPMRADDFERLYAAVV